MINKTTLFFLLFLLPIRFLAQDLTWAKGMSGTGGAVGSTICLDNIGNVYTIGQFKGTIDFDPGTNVASLTSINPFDYFITKMDSSGNLIWAKQFGSWYEYGGSVPRISIDNLGNVFAVGSYTGSADFDPGAGISILTTSGLPIDIEDNFVLKLDNSGNFIWVKALVPAVNSNANRLYSMAIDNLGDIYLTGSFNNTVDFDPGSGVSILQGNPTSAFICKFNGSGNFLWANRIGNYGSGNFCSTIGTTVLTDQTGNIYVSGYCYGSIAYNFTPICNSGSFVLKLDINGTYVSSISLPGYNAQSALIDASGNSFIFTYSSANIFTIIKLDVSGNMLWTKAFDYHIEAHGAALSQSDNIFLSGAFYGTVDFDPGIGITNLSSTNPNLSDAFILKINNDGDFLWAKKTGGTSYGMGNEIAVDASENMYSTGTYNTTRDFDPSINIYNLVPGPGPKSAFVCKLKKNICSDLALLIDTVSGINCSNFGYASGHCVNGLAPYNYSWNTTPITTNTSVIMPNTGIYALTVSDANNCSISSSVIINAPSYMSGVDLNPSIVSAAFRPGFMNTIFMDAFNDGCVPATGKLKLILDPRLIYNYSTPIPNTISGDTLIWSFYNLIYDSTHIKPFVSVTNPTSTAIGDTIVLTTIMTPFYGDTDTLNNIKIYKTKVVNAFDPNEKTVFPSGKCDEGYILNNQLLTYTIRFQNTGNADAIDISILDQLDKNLNPNTVKIIGYSHPVYAELLENDVMKFNFKNINLPDSNSNEPKSHGYLIFEVMQDTNLNNGSKIKNSVGIYFDYNIAVLTNTVINTIVDVISEDCASKNTQASYDKPIALFPNPTSKILNIEVDAYNSNSEIMITDVLGRTVFSQKIESAKTVINTDTYNKGIYFITVITENKQSTTKIIIQ